MMRGPKNHYQALLASGALAVDPAQAQAIEALHNLHDALSHHTKAPPKGLTGLFWRPTPPPQGLYLWGGVGRGKSLLMDIFFETSPLLRKRRVHFHAFMAETHERIAQWRKMDDRTRKKMPYWVKKAALDDPIPHVANATFQQAKLLCFDEFQVSDIADAMLLGRFFEALFRLGSVVVATSNRHPNDLYGDGLNRDLFLPFIQKLQKQLTIHELRAAKDYRLAQLAGVPVYHTPLGPIADAAMDKAWQRLIAGAPEHGETLIVRGHNLPIERVVGGVARVSFSSLCEKALGAEDYLEIAQNYNTVFMDNIPLLSPEKRNEAKRFVTLIDAFYEHKTKFVCSAAAAPQYLYPAGDGAFEFDRTVSRLIEMQSAAYLGQEHSVECARPSL